MSVAVKILEGDVRGLSQRLPRWLTLLDLRLSHSAENVTIPFDSPVESPSIFCADKTLERSQRAGQMFNGGLA